MKLTQEQETALRDALRPYGLSEGDLPVPECVAVLVGYRLGFEAAREAAAKVAESDAIRELPGPMPDDLWRKVKDGDQNTAILLLRSTVTCTKRECAAAIRAIPLPGGEK